MTHPLIEARELHAHYGQSHVLQGVTLSVARGELVGLLGRTGMGGHLLVDPGASYLLGGGRHHPPK